MIGSEALAREISEWAFEHYATGKALPEGWTLAGQGVSRIVFLGPDGVCYKIMTENLRGAYFYRQGLDVSHNFAEAYTYETHGEKISSLSGGKARLAACHYFYDLDVLAMEYSKAIGAADWYNDMRVFSENGLGADLHGQNVWIDEKGIVCVDYAIAA